MKKDWDPRVDKQALQRAHRVDQMHHVLAIRIKQSQGGDYEKGPQNIAVGHNVIGHDDVDPKAHRSDSIAGGDLRSIIMYGLHEFDPS